MRMHVFTHEHAQPQQEVHCVRMRLKSFLASNLASSYPLCSFIFSIPFIYLYPFPHPLLAKQQPPHPSSFRSPLFCTLKVEENTTVWYLALCSACTAGRRQRHRHLHKE